MFVMILYDDLELCGTMSVLFVSFRNASHGCHETMGHVHAQANLGCDDLMVGLGVSHGSLPFMIPFLFNIPAMLLILQAHGHTTSSRTNGK